MYYYYYKNYSAQILSRQRPAISTVPLADKESVSKQPKLPDLEEYLDNRDYTGALTLLEVFFCNLIG